MSGDICSFSGVVTVHAFVTVNLLIEHLEMSVYYYYYLGVLDCLHATVMCRESSSV